MKHITLCALALALPVMAGHPTGISSPDERITLSTSEKDGTLSYSVSFNGKPVIGDSQLGVILNKDTFSSGVKVTKGATSTHDETWEAVWGTQAEFRDHYNELTFELTEVDAPNRKMGVTLRAYNDGVAFRYSYPEQEGLKEANLKEELSQVSVISENPVAWYAKSSTTLFNDVPFTELSASCRTPFTAKLAEDAYIAIHEAAITNSSDANLIPSGEGKKTLTFTCKSDQSTGTTSAWRTILITEKPGDLIESTMIMNLNAPNKITDTSWIKPGVSLWDWRNHGGKTEDGHVYGIDTASYLRYVDFAAKHGLAYFLIDAEWYGSERDPKQDPTTTVHNKHADVDMDKVCAYAKENGVGVWVYINDKALKGFDLDRTFKKYAEWGIKGIKHGFLGGGAQNKNAFSVKVIEKCAEYKIMYNLHEPNKPTGLTRTYPHYMSNEYVNSMLDAATRPPATPSEMCVYPVVHNLGGPVDRSCGLFGMDVSIGRDKVHKQIPSTVTSQVAQCLIIYSGILTLPDMPEAYEAKADLFEFIAKLPMTYDETRVLDMEIGNHISMARRNGDQWFVASLADEDGRTTEISLDFLAEGTEYDITYYEDTAESHYEFPGGWNVKDAKKKKVKFVPVETKRELYQVRTGTAKKGDKVSALIAPGGGHCMWIRPKK